MGAGDLDGQSCFLHRLYLYGWQDNTNLHEILTDIVAKILLRGVYFFERKTIRRVKKWELILYAVY